MVRRILSVLAFLFVMTCSGIQHTEVDSVDVFDPAYSYVVLTMDYSTPFSDVSLGGPFGSSDATGVVVSESPNGYYVVTADHFCRSQEHIIVVQQMRAYLLEMLKVESDTSDPVATDMTLDNLTQLTVAREAESLLGVMGEWIYVDSHPTLDLCLIDVITEQTGLQPVPSVGRVEDLNSYGREHGVTNVPVYALGAPNPDVFFFPNPQHYLPRWEGYWVGHYRPGMIATTIRVRPGQSGSGLFFGDSLIGILVSYNPRLEVDISFAVGPEGIRELLYTNGLSF
jgi:hypothetical protein